MQYVLQAPNFTKLRAYLPKFMEKVNTDPTFVISEVDLKFSKPELSINIDREKAKVLAFRCRMWHKPCNLRLQASDLVISIPTADSTRCSANLNAVIGMSPSTSQPCM